MKDKKRKIKIETYDGIFDCTGDLLYEGRNSKSIYSQYPISINNRYVYVVYSDIDKCIRSFYKKEIKKIIYK